jgi:hypothetical protein
MTSDQRDVNEHYPFSEHTANMSLHPQSRGNRSARHPDLPMPEAEHTEAFPARRQFEDFLPSKSLSTWKADDKVRQKEQMYRSLSFRAKVVTKGAAKYAAAKGKEKWTEKVEKPLAKAAEEAVGRAMASTLRKPEEGTKQKRLT